MVVTAVTITVVVVAVAPTERAAPEIDVVQHREVRVHPGAKASGAQAALTGGAAALAGAFVGIGGHPYAQALLVELAQAAADPRRRQHFAVDGAGIVV